MRVKVTTLISNFEILIYAKQAHYLHYFILN